MPKKDRRRTIYVDSTVKILVHRSSAHPVEYAICLLVKRDGEWFTVRTFDNAHDVGEHHEHRYRGRDKQKPVILMHADVNAAMSYAIDTLLNAWPALVESWEKTR